MDDASPRAIRVDRRLVFCDPEFGMTLPPWPYPLQLSPDWVEVIRVPFTLSSPQLTQLEGMLADAEREHAARIRHPDKRRELVVGRGMLRLLLGRLLQVSPPSIAFSIGPHGKPELAEPPASSGIRFNVSHTQGMALIALGRNRALGVDVECIRPETDYLSLAQRFFSPPEAAALQALPADRQRSAFFAIWTRKEAFLKALGTGISRGLDSFDVSVEGPARLLRTAWDASEVHRWQLAALEMEAGYQACVAAEGGGWAVRRWEIPWLPA